MGISSRLRVCSPATKKVAAVQDALPHVTVAEVQSFMGLVQYCARFISDLATISEPIQEMTRKGVAFRWGKELKSFKR